MRPFDIRHNETNNVSGNDILKITFRSFHVRGEGFFRLR